MSRARLPIVAVAALCAAMGVYLAIGRGEEASLERADTQLRAGHRSAALHELEGLSGQASGRAAALRGDAYLGGGRYGAAAAELSKAARRAPNDWLVQRDYAIALRRLGRRGEARAQMQRALALNPLMALPTGFRTTNRRSRQVGTSAR